MPRTVPHRATLLFPLDVVNIRIEYENGPLTHRALARKYHVSMRTICAVINREGVYADDRMNRLPSAHQPTDTNRNIRRQLHKLLRKEYGGFVTIEPLVDPASGHPFAGFGVQIKQTKALLTVQSRTICVSVTRLKSGKQLAFRHFAVPNAAVHYLTGFIDGFCKLTELID